MGLAESTSIFQKLAALPKETDWVEYKHSFHSPKEIGERISAMVTSATLLAESNVLHARLLGIDCEYVKL